ncbi:MAG: ATP-binding cassette domain-containing protein [Clostridia bacterium]|nr:ATP-binding cassette domain-containing protein [Clostridia bacterium]
MIELIELCRKYGDNAVLDNIGFSFKPGITAVLAPNGAGKTTMIKMLTTTLAPTSGRILWNGRDISEKAVESEYLRTLACVPQIPGFYPAWTAPQFMRYLSYLRGVCDGMTSREIDKRIAEELEFFGLSDKCKLKMGKFSAGMIKRVFLAEAFFADSELYIFDEPTAGLDPLECEKLKRRIAELGKTKTVIISTHIISDVEDIANDVVLLKNGRIAVGGDAEEARRSAGAETLHELFLSVFADGDAK